VKTKEQRGEQAVRPEGQKPKAGKGTKSGAFEEKETGEKMDSKACESWENPVPKEEALGKKLSELEDTLKRVQAEFENSRKRLDREKEDFARVANAHLIRDLLPIIDSMEAASNGNSQGNGGLVLVRKQLLAVLGSHGLEEMQSLGKRFDPMLHDCVMQGSEKEKDDGVVLEEIQKGYLLNGKVLRHARVKVNRNEGQNENHGEARN